MNAQHPGESIRVITAEIVAQAEEQVRKRLGGRVSDLRVIVRGDGLVLQGRSRTHHAKQLAQQAVIEATGLPIVTNEIWV